MLHGYDFAVISVLFGIFFEFFTLNIVALGGDRSTKLQQSVISKGLIEFTLYMKHSMQKATLFC